MDALEVGRALDDLGAYWFEEPVAPEDRAGYAELRAGVDGELYAISANRDALLVIDGNAAARS